MRRGSVQSSSKLEVLSASRPIEESIASAGSTACLQNPLYAIYPATPQNMCLQAACSAKSTAASCQSKASAAGGTSSSPNLTGKQQRRQSQEGKPNSLLQSVLRNSVQKRLQDQSSLASPAGSAKKSRLLSSTPKASSRHLSKHISENCEHTFEVMQQICLVHI